MSNGLPFESGNYGEDKLKVMHEVLEQALRIGNIGDRNDPRCKSIAHLIIGLFEAGEKDPKRIASMAVGKH